MRIILIVFFLNALNTYGQIDLEMPITLEAGEISMKDLFETLESKYEIVVAYGSDHISPELNITIPAEATTLSEILRIVCARANLSYQIIDDVIVFKYLGISAPREVIRGRRSVSEPTQNDEPPASTVDPGLVGGINDSISNEVRILPDRFQVPRPPFHFDLENVKLPDLELLSPPVATPPRPKQRKKRNIQMGLFCSYAIDFNDFKFTEPAISFQKYATALNPRVGVGTYVVLRPKLTLSLGLGYTMKSFSLEYNYMVLDPDDPFPIPDRTLVELHYLDLPLTIAYGLFLKRQYSVWVATGFYPALLVNDDENTTYKNQRDKETDYFLSANQQALYAGAIELILRRSINPSWGFFLNPGALYAFGSVNEKAIRSNFVLYRLNAGVQLLLQSKN